MYVSFLTLKSVRVCQTISKKLTFKLLTLNGTVLPLNPNVQLGEFQTSGQEASDDVEFDLGKMQVQIVRTFFSTA